MDDYAPASSLGWLDFDAAATERVATLLRSLEEPRTLDVLGLLSVSNTFSEMLSPGTSTVQTKLRYFIFLPWIFMKLEAKPVPASGFARRLRDAEARLIDCLRPLGSGHGVIGYYAGRDLKTMPSSIYWGGLGAWGIRRLDYSPAEHGKRVAATGRHQQERDDDGNATRRNLSMWAPVPPPPDDFLEAELTFELRSGEAAVLVDCIRQHCPNTLLSALCARPELAVDVEFPWELPTNGMPDRLVEVLHHARCFSELTLGPQLLYNVLVARRAKAELGWDTEGVEANQLDRLTQWTELVDNRRLQLCSWVEDRPRFWQILDGHSNHSTQSFVNEITGRAAADPQRFIDDPEVHALIRDRERRLKSKRARLSYRSALENWNQAPVGGQLDYRWGITKSYLADIAAALPRPEVDE